MQLTVPLCTMHACLACGMNVCSWRLPYNNLLASRAQVLDMVATACDGTRHELELPLEPDQLLAGVRCCSLATCMEPAAVLLPAHPGYTGI